MNYKLGDNVFIIGLLPFSTKLDKNQFIKGTIININYYSSYPFTVLTKNGIYNCLIDQISSFSTCI